MKPNWSKRASLAQKAWHLRSFLLEYVSFNVLKFGFEMVKRWLETDLEDVLRDLNKMF